MKKYTDEYMVKRAVDLSYFISCCFTSETIKQDYLFESFADISDYNEYKKAYNKFSKTVQEIKHLSGMVVLPEESTEVQLPDKKRLAAAQNNHSELTKEMRIYHTTQDRLHQNFKRLGDDLLQVNKTIRCIREGFKTLEYSETRLRDKFDVVVAPF